jgi:hypothetical protein
LLRVSYPYEATDPEEQLMVAYLREFEGRTYMIGGPEGSPVLEAAVDRFMEVMP